tara:strand:+ start:1211 stop:2398 length:1188 start_codon:yes stop_codon:yes gene_type:complete
MQQNIISAVDIRADKIICLIAQELQIINKGKILQLIGIGTSKMPVDCLKPLALDSEIIKKYIGDAIKSAENEAGVKLQDIFVSISENLSSKYLNFEVNIGNSNINEENIKQFFSSDSFKELYTQNEEPLHSFPISYRINDKKSVSEPIGQKADKLMVKWHIINVSKDYLNKVYSLFNELEINLKQVVSSHYSSSLAVLDDYESDNGAVTIDIQKNKTILSYTFDGQIIGYDLIKIGTYHFTNDISQIKSISLDESEKIRKQLDIVDFDRKNNKTLDRFFDIYISRANELVDLINRKIETSRFNSLISSNIVLTGYGAKSLTVQKLMKQKFNLKQFRLGSTKKINGSKTFLDNPSLVSAFGLLSYATNHVLEGENTDKNTKKKSILSIFYHFFRNL